MNFVTYVSHIVTELVQCRETRDACQAENSRLVLENRELRQQLADHTQIAHEFDAKLARRPPAQPDTLAALHGGVPHCPTCGDVVLLGDLATSRNRLGPRPARCACGWVGNYSLIGNIGVTA